MDLGAIQTAVTSWVETYSSLECEWGKMPQAMHAGPFVLAYLGPIVGQGHDELIQVYDFDTDSTTVSSSGVRQMTIRLSFRSYDQRLAYSARQFAETFRVAVRSTSSLDALKTAELGLINTGELVETDYTYSGRMINQVDMDVNFSVRAIEADPNHDGSYIKYVNIDTEEYVEAEDADVVVDVSGDYVTVDIS